MALIRSLFSDQQDDPFFMERVRNGEFVEISPGNYQSRQAAESPLGALADYHRNGSGNSDSNTSGAWILSGSGGADAVDRFCDSLGHPRRHD